MARWIPLVILAAVTGGPVIPSHAAVVCRAKSGRLALREGTTCRRRETVVNLSALAGSGRDGRDGATGAPGTPGPTGSVGPAGAAGSPGVRGAPGATGSPGADGQLRIYGDGSAGSRTIAADLSLADPSPLYDDFTVEAGVTLSLSSGTVIRCRGTFRNDGTILVGHGAAAGGVGGAPPHPGISRGAPGTGAMGGSDAFLIGGGGGVGMTLEQARTVLFPGVVSGGAGAGAAIDGRGHAGGGSFVVLALAGLVNGGVIRADGDGNGSSGGAGGAGGVVILASPATLEQRGTISAVGGAGEAADADEGANGGGGGGVVHLIAPMVENTGIVDVSGGAGGAGSSLVSGSPRSGGGGGGACGGDGGAGGSVESTGQAPTASSGLAGHSIVTIADPTPLF